MWKWNLRKKVEKVWLKNEKSSFIAQRMELINTFWLLNCESNTWHISWMLEENTNYIKESFLCIS